MKRITLFFISIFLLIPAFSQVLAPQRPVKVKWYSINEALILNKTQPRKIMIDVYTDWCGWCKKMDHETFSHPVVAKYLNDYFYPVKFNAESFDSVEFNGKKYFNQGTPGTRSSHQFAVTLLNGQMSYPSVVYLTETLQLLGAVPGYKTPDQQEVLLNYIAFDKFKTVSFEEFQKTFVSQIAKP